MKRFIPLILSIVIVIGALAPVSLSLTQNGGVGLSPTSVEAQATPPPTAGSTTATTTTAQTTPYTPPANVGQYIDCSGSIFWGSNGGCLAWLFFYVPYDIGSWAMAMTAKAFDLSANFTLSSKLFTANNSGFLTQGWSITRDIANIFFILILLMAALSLVLGMDIGHVNPKRALGLVIVVAILINFSFFMTEVVIDISNSLALVFYNQISVITKQGAVVPDPVTVQLATAGDQYITNVKPISVDLVESFVPQYLASAQFYNQLATLGNNGFFSSPPAATAGTTISSATKIPPSTLIPLFIIIGLMYLVVAYSFLIALIALIGRLVNLFIAIIFAPLAFVSYIIPSAKTIPGFGWDEWAKGLMTNAFAAPIYFFLLFLAALLTQISILPSDPTKFMALSPGLMLLLILIQFAVVITLILKATSFMKKASGEVGNFVFGLAGGLGKAALAGAGLAAGTVAGAAAFGGSKIIGGVGNRIVNDRDLQDKAAGIGTNKFGQFVAKQQLKLASGATKASFDIRQNRLVSGLSSAAGINLGGVGIFSTKKTAGGREARVARMAAKDQEFMKLFREDEARKREIKDIRETREGQLDEMKKEKNKKEADNKILENTQDFKDLKNEVETAVKLKDNATRSGNAAAITAADAALTLAKQNFSDGKTAAGNTLGIDYTVNEIRTADLKKQMIEIEDGESDSDGKKIRAMAGDRKADGTIVTPQEAARIKMRHGQPVLTTAGQTISDAPIKKESLSIAELKSLEEAEGTRLQRAYIHSVNKDTGFGVHTPTFDKLGNILESHIDKQARGSRSLQRTLMEGFRGAMSGAALSAALAPLTFGLSSIAGAVGGGLAGLTTQIGKQMTRGSSEYADAAHHLQAKANDPHADHGKGGHDGGYHYSPNSSFFNALKDIFKSKGGGGGEHGGGGDHGGGHH